MENEKVFEFTIDVNLGRGVVILLALALVAASLVGYMALGRQNASASEAEAPLASSANMREYYLTTSTFNGAQADTACASGYHMASLWEIMDPSHLKYNTTLGTPPAGTWDMGQGPVSGAGSGWIRTGYVSGGAGTAGHGNCNAWTSNSIGDNGTYAVLDSNWGTVSGLEFNDIWSVGYVGCNSYRLVWCIED